MSATTAQLIGLAAISAAVLFGAWAKGALAGARAHRRAAQRFAERSWLPAEAVDEELARRVIRRHRLVLLGIWAGLTTSLVIGESWVLAYVGLALGAVADRLIGHRPAPDAPRAAHARVTRVTDYLPRWLLGAVGVAVLAAGALVVCWFAAPRPALGPYHASTAVALGTLLPAVLALAASAGLTRLVLRRPQPVASTLELAVDDALRAQALRDALHLATAAAIATALLFATELLQTEIQGSLRFVAGAAPMVFLLALVVVGTWHEATGGPAYWRTRLHPELVGIR